MIIDGHCHVTDIDEPVWGWKAFTGDDLIKIMDINFPVNGELRIVDKAVIMPEELDEEMEEDGEGQEGGFLCAQRTGIGPAGARRH